MTDDYAGLAADYHHLRAGQTALDVVRRYARPDATILDCACGIGTDAVGLALDGRAVWASDGSAAMVAQARRRMAAAGVSVPLAVCRWDQLPDCYAERFDVVLCLGNSISHLGPEEMPSALAGMAAVLRPAARLVLTCRNWEKLRRQRPRVTVAPGFDGSGGQRCLPLYLWSWEDDWEAPHRVEILFVVEDAGDVTVRRHELTFRPFRVGDLRRHLEQAGLQMVAGTYDPDADWYEVVAARPGPPVSRPSPA